VTDFSQRLLADHGGLRGLLRLEVTELVRVLLLDTKHRILATRIVSQGSVTRRRSEWPASPGPVLMTKANRPAAYASARHSAANTEP